jgi:hypothetical protein
MKLLGLCESVEAPRELEYRSSFDINNLWRIPQIGDLITHRMPSKIVKYSLEMKNHMRIRLPTSSIYKWDSMLSHIDPTIYDFVLVLGDGIGFTSLVASRRCNDSIIYPSALIERRKFIPQDMKSWRPAASRMYSNVHGDLLEMVPDDVLGKEWPESFLKFLSNLNEKTLVLTDFESQGGNKNLVVKVKNILDYQFPHIHQIHKVYFHEFFNYPLSGALYTNPYCNTQYYEGFVSNIAMESKEFPAKVYYSEEFWEVVNGDTSIFEGMRTKEVNYDEALGTCVRISKNTFFRNFVPITSFHLSNVASVVLHYQLEYISGNFKAPHQGIIPEDTRLMLDGILIRVIKGIKMLLIMLYGKEIMAHEYFKLLHLVKASRDDRFKGLKNLQVVLCIGERVHDLSSKEISSATVLRHTWVLNRDGAVLPSPPTSLEDLYLNEIIKGKELRKIIRN